MNGRAGDGEPPPSTFAAQIVDNLERTQRQNSLSSSTAHLSELLNAILVADRQNLSSEEAFDNNLGVNQKLICVIVQARLLKLSSNNPFDDNDKLHRQACGCLAVIELLIRRFPDLLYLHPEPQDTTRPDGPLFLWLLPHIINLINYRNHEDIQTGAKEVLTAIVHSHAQSPTVKGLPQPTLQYVRGCVKGMGYFSYAMV